MSFTVISNVTVIDGTGADAAPAQDVVLRDGLIDSITPTGSKDLSSADLKVDGTGKFLLPGFIDSHVHMTLAGGDINPADAIHRPPSMLAYLAAANLRKTLEAGVTYVRDLSGADVGTAMAIDEGLIPGPRMKCAVQAIGPTGGHSDAHTLGGHDMARIMAGVDINPIVDGIDEARKRTRQLIRAGADVIKVMGSGGVWSPRDDPNHDGFSFEEIRAVVLEAANKSIPVASHTQGTSGIKNAARAGVTSIEHGYLIDDEGIDLMLENEVWLVPTLTTGTTPPNAQKAPPYAFKKKTALQERLRGCISAAADRGVQFALGTDCGVVPHGQNLRELYLMTTCGLSPMEALKAGTVNAANLLGVSDIVGSIEVGKQADLVLTEVDPLSQIEDLSTPDNILLVFQQGLLKVDRRG